VQKRSKIIKQVNLTAQRSMKHRLSFIVFNFTLTVVNTAVSKLFMIFMIHNYFRNITMSKYAYQNIAVSGSLEKKADEDAIYAMTPSSPFFCLTNCQKMLHFFHTTILTMCTA
jgi:hypothetical protein